MQDRDDKGRFVKGNGGGPGRPKRSIEEQYLDILLRTCTPEDWQKIVLSAVTHAKAGDSRAREWLGNYILGKPVERHEVSGPEGGPVAVEHSIDGDTIAEALAILGGGNGCQGCGK